MAQPAQGKDPGITPSQTISITYVNNAFKPSPDPATIPLGGSVEFENDTTQAVCVELFTHENKEHVAISVYIAAGDSVYLCNDPQHSNSFCYYNIAAYPPSSGITDTSSGGHTIQVGSGNPDDDQ
jgi:hypothetical protein